MICICKWISMNIEHWIDRFGCEQKNMVPWTKSQLYNSIVISTKSQEEKTKMLDLLLCASRFAISNGDNNNNNKLISKIVRKKNTKTCWFQVSVNKSAFEIVTVSPLSPFTFIYKMFVILNMHRMFHSHPSVRPSVGCVQWKSQNKCWKMSKKMKKKNVFN